MNRTLEVIITVFAGIAAIPAFVLTMAILRLSLGGPSFFAQTRVGKDGSVLVVSKLRTMSDERDASGALLPDHLRQTRVSGLIRKLRIDEVPQLWLILCRRMALVGPRPLLPETIAEFGEDGARRCTVRPGLTGWAQVSGNTKLTDREKLDLDLWYIENRNAWLDLRILFESIGVALFGERRRPDRLARVGAGQRSISRPAS